MRPPPTLRVLCMLFALLVATALAGCTGPGGDRDDDTDGGMGDPLDPARLAGLPPGWIPGLVYSYRVEHPATEFAGPLRFVVLDGPGTDFTLDPIEEDEAGAEAVSWLLYRGFPLGPVAYEDFEPRVDGIPLNWFSFPMQDAATWHGKAPDGTPLAFNAVATTTRLPGGGDEVPAYAVVGTHDGADVLGYTYTGHVGWFESFWWDVTGDGEPDITMRYEGLSMDPGLTERPPRAPQRVLDLHVQGPDVQGVPGLPGVPGPGVPHAAHDFTIGADGSDVYFMVQRSGGPGLYEVEVSWDGGEDGVGWQWVHDGPEPSRSWGHAHRTPGTGTAGAGQDAQATVWVLAEGEVHVVGVRLHPVS